MFGADFLACTAEEVMAGEAEAWGGHSREISCPGGPYLVRGLAEVHLEEVDAHFGEFLARDEHLGAWSAAMDVRRPAEGTFVPWRGTAGQFFLDVICEAERVLIAGVGFLARLGLVPPMKLTVWSAREPHRGFAEMVENALRVLASYRLLGVGGCLLHGAAVVLEEGAYVLVGRSGAGKSTLTLLARDEGCEVVSDDLAAVVPCGSGFEVAATPFAGELRLVGHPCRRAPLVSVSRLAKGTEHGWKTLPPSVAVASVAACAPFVNVDPHRAERLLDIIGSVVESVAVGELTFARRAGVVAAMKSIGRGR